MDKTYDYTEVNPHNYELCRGIIFKDTKGNEWFFGDKYVIAPRYGTMTLFNNSIKRTSASTMFGLDQIRSSGLFPLWFNDENDILKNML